MLKTDLKKGLKYAIWVKESDNASKWTIRDYGIVVEELISFIGNLNVEDIKTHHIREFIRFTQERGLANSTVNIRIRYLKAFFNILLEDNLVSEGFKNPVEGITLRSVDESASKDIPFEILKKLFDAVDTSTFTGYRNYVCMLMMLSNGIRPSEMLSLKVTDWKDSHIMVRESISKTRKFRLVPVPSELEKELYRYLVFKGDWGGELMFPNYEGEQLTTHAFGLAIRRLASKAEVDEGTIFPYAFRHTFAINYLRRGGDVFKLRRILGHKTLEMTERYVKWDISDILETFDGTSLVSDLIGNKETKRRRR